MFETTLPRTRIELSLRGGCLNVFELDDNIGAKKGGEKGLLGFEYHIIFR